MPTCLVPRRFIPERVAGAVCRSFNDSLAGRSALRRLGSLGSLLCPVGLTDKGKVPWPTRRASFS